MKRIPSLNPLILYSSPKPRAMPHGRSIFSLATCLFALSLVFSSSVNADANEGHLDAHVIGTVIEYRQNQGGVVVVKVHFNGTWNHNSVQGTGTLTLVTEARIALGSSLVGHISGQGEAQLGRQNGETVPFGAQGELLKVDLRGDSGHLIGTKGGSTDIFKLERGDMVVVSGEEQTI